MSIVKLQSHEMPYVIIDKRPLENNALSWKAKGLLAYLISKPQDWQIRTSQLIEASSDGKDSLYGAIDELMEHGYCTRTEYRDAIGKVKGYDYVIYEVSQVGGLPGSGFPGSGKSATTKEGVYTKEGSNTLSLEQAPAQEEPSPTPEKKLAPSPAIFRSIVEGLFALDGIQFIERRPQDYSRVRGVAKSIFAATPSVTIEEFNRRVDNYRKKWPRATCSSTAINKHWPSLSSAPDQSKSTSDGIINHSRFSD